MKMNENIKHKNSAVRISKLLLRRKHFYTGSVKFFGRLTFGVYGASAPSCTNSKSPSGDPSQICVVCWWKSGLGFEVS